MLKKSIHIDLFYTELPYEQRFAAARKDGFDAVEFYYPGWEDKDLPAIKRLAEENGLEICAATGATPYSMCDPAQREDYLAYIKKLLNAAQAINCPILMIHSNVLEASAPFGAAPLTREYSETTKLCAMFDVLRTIAPWGEKAGVAFTLEPLSETAHPGYFLHTIETCVDLVKAVGSPYVKALYDAYHVYLEEGNVSTKLEKYAEWVGHVHVADAPGRHEPGTGDVNWANFLKQVDRLPYDGYVAFELYPLTSSEKAVEAIKNVCHGL